MNEHTPSHVESRNGPQGRILVLEPDEHVSAAVMDALREAAPSAEVSLGHSLEEAQRMVADYRPDLFVLDVDATYDLGQEFLYDLRTSHPNARAIVLTAVHLAAHREQVAELGAIHFLEKPFPHSDFVDLVQALLSPSSAPEGEKFQGTLSDLHIADIIQLKCMSGSTSGLEFTGPCGEKARVYFEGGQVRHATAPGQEGITAFNEIVNWKGGKISEVSGFGDVPPTIDLDWQILLMEAVRKIDETRGTKDASTSTNSVGNRKVLVIDDSLMLLSFVNEILTEAHYQVVTASTAEEGLAAAAKGTDLILLDYILPDMKGDEVSQRLSADRATAKIPVVYMSGFGSDLQADALRQPNVIGSLNKPFTSELLLKTVEHYIPKNAVSADAMNMENEPAPETASPVERSELADVSPVSLELAEESARSHENDPVSLAATENFEAAATSNLPDIAAAAVASSAPWWSPPTSAPAWPEISTAAPVSQHEDAPQNFPEPAGAAALPPLPDLPALNGNTYFSGDTSFFSLNWALHTIEKQQLTGVLRCFWTNETVEALARAGKIVLVTTRDPALYCPEAPITLANVDAEHVQAARERQRETGCPLFITLTQDDLILREPAHQLVQHYGQKLFAQLWTAPRVRFLFEQNEQLPDYANEIAVEEDVDHWSLSTLRFIQFPDLGAQQPFAPLVVPAYTRDGFERVQDLRLTVAEAQFASQFNGVRSVQQIAKNLRIDMKFARLTLFRFLALEIVDCWPADVAAKPEKRGFFQRLGFGD
ncbi:MAG: response regulator [Chthoniobacterales bacterium]|nr:response regulator [Chthoniobacterales bacterium]